MSNPTSPLPTKPSKRLSRLCERHLRLRAKGAACYDKARETLKKAISAGLMPEQPVEIPNETGQFDKFTLVDNFAHAEVAFRSASIPRFELKKMSKKAAAAAEKEEAQAA